MRYALALCVLLLLVSSSSFAQEISDKFNDDEVAAKVFQQALRSNDKKAVANMIYYPLEREFPLVSIETPDDFVAHWDEYFDADITKEVLEAKPEQIGSHGVQLVNGLIWFKDAKVFKIHYRTSVFQKLFKEAKEKEGQFINSEAQGYKRLILSCQTKTKFIRIQEHNDGIHYFVWKKGESLTSKPELNLIGEYFPDGSGGNGHYTFKNHGYSYVVEDVILCENLVCHKKLIISKNGSEISNQVCN